MKKRKLDFYVIYVSFLLEIDSSFAIAYFHVKRIIHKSFYS